LETFPAALPLGHFGSKKQHIIEPDIYQTYRVKSTARGNGPSINKKGVYCSIGPGVVNAFQDDKFFSY
jgi:hypothetical protein